MIRPLAWPRLVGIGQDSQHNRTVAVPLSVTAFRAGSAGPLCSSTYRELPGAGAGPVACIWTGRPGWSPRSLRLLPDGCVDVVWDGTAIAVVPPRAAAVRHNLTAQGFSVGVRLRAGWAAQTLRTSIGPLPAVANMADVRSDAGVPQFAEALAGLSDPVVAAWLLARWVERLRPAGSVPETRLLGAIDLLARPGSSVRTAASGAGYSVRELHRRFVGQVGLSPKSFQRVARFQRFRRLIASTGAPRTMAEAAALCGYADEAHLAHDCHDLASLTPAVLARVAGAAQRPPAPLMRRAEGG